jgi:type IV secretion system protein VirB4
VVCELDLKGMDLELSVISGRTATIQRMHALRDSLGMSVDAWLPRLLEQGDST